MAVNRTQAEKNARFRISQEKRLAAVERNLDIILQYLCDYYGYPSLDYALGAIGSLAHKHSWHPYEMIILYGRHYHPAIGPLTR